jgi:hypothetical protein
MVAVWNRLLETITELPSVGSAPVFIESREQRKCLGSVESRQSQQLLLVISISAIILTRYQVRTRTRVLWYIRRLFSCRWGENVSLNCGQQRAYFSSHRWYVNMESYGGIILTGKIQRTQRKTCPSATLSSTNHTRNDPGANSGLRGESPLTNHLSHDATFCFIGDGRIYSEIGYGYALADYDWYGVMPKAF